MSRLRSLGVTQYRVLWIMAWSALGWACASYPGGRQIPTSPRPESNTAQVSHSGSRPSVESTAEDESYPPDTEALEDDDSGADSESEEPAAAGGDEQNAGPRATSQEIESSWKADPASVGSISLGKPNGGVLINGVQMPDGDGWSLVDRSHAWGTQETVDALVHCIQKVRQQFPDAPPLHVGHLSAKNGGHLRPHRSHQSGRDADLGYYYTGNQHWFARAGRGNLDRGPTWALVRALITDTNVELILIDSSIQELLRDYAASMGEDPDWLNRVFRGMPGKAPPIVRHIRGHATHIHVRFFSPAAEETARILRPTLAKEGKLAPRYITVRARKGDTLASWAKRYGCTVREIQQANGLRSTRLVAKRDYRIPQKEGAAKGPPPPRPRAKAGPEHGPNGLRVPRLRNPQKAAERSSKVPPRDAAPGGAPAAGI